VAGAGAPNLRPGAILSKARVKSSGSAEEEGVGHRLRRRTADGWNARSPRDTSGHGAKFGQLPVAKTSGVSPSGW
jgi:hypothetical protein